MGRRARRSVGLVTKRWTGPGHDGTGEPHPACAPGPGRCFLGVAWPLPEKPSLVDGSARRRWPVTTWLAEHGRPIRYGYVPQAWPLSAYQNVYATEPGSAEMPSAGRPFSADMVTRLVAGGVGVAPIVLHTGVASLEADELPYPSASR